MEKFIMKPSIDLYPGIKVTKDTKLDFKNNNVEQTIENLTFHSITKVTGEGYESIYDTTIELKEGDILVFEDEGRGYIKPVEEVMSIKDAKQILEDIEGLDKE